MKVTMYMTASYWSASTGSFWDQRLSRNSYQKSI